MAERNHERLRNAIHLASEPPFRLGVLQVHPSTRQVGRDGQAQTLEPRIMQVLVALVRAEGQVVSRDELIDRCWNGRAVGDNAIHRALSRVRDLSLGLAEESFKVETISKVGYRLLENYQAPYPDTLEPAKPDLGPPAVEATDASRGPVAPATQGPTRQATVVATILATLLLTITAVLGWLLWPTPSDRHSIAVLPQPGSGSDALAREILVDLARLAGLRGNQLTVTDDPASAGFVVRIAQATDGNRRRLDLSLAAGTSGDLLWSSSLNSDAAGPTGLSSQASARLGQVLLCALRPYRNGQMLSDQILHLYLSACERMEAPPDQQVLTLLQRVTQEAPQFSYALGDLAMAQAHRYTTVRVADGPAAAEAVALVAAVRGNVERARSLDPEIASAYAAEVELLDPGMYAERLSLLERALVHNGSDPLLYDQRSRALFAIGRLSAAVADAERAAALDPLSPLARATLVTALAHSNSLGRARRELAEAERLWPESEQLRLARFSIELRYGDPRIAQRMIDEGRDLLSGRTGGFGGTAILMRARLTPSPENTRRLVRFASIESRRAPEPIALRAQALGHAGAIEEFYGLLDQPGVIEHLRNASQVLFRPHLKSFRDDVRFLRLAARLGLLRLWAASGLWPDYCRDPRLPYDCERDGRRILRL